MYGILMVNVTIYSIHGSYELYTYKIIKGFTLYTWHLKFWSILPGMSIQKPPGSPFGFFIFFPGDICWMVSGFSEGFFIFFIINSPEWLNNGNYGWFWFSILTQGPIPGRIQSQRHVTGKWAKSTKVPGWCVVPVGLAVHLWMCHTLDPLVAQRTGIPGVPVPVPLVFLFRTSVQTCFAASNITLTTQMLLLYRISSIWFGFCWGAKPEIK